MSQTTMVLAQVVVSVGVIAAGVWVLGRVLDRTASKERREIERSASAGDDDDDEKQLRLLVRR